MHVDRKTVEGGGALPELDPGEVDAPGTCDDCDVWNAQRYVGRRVELHAVMAPVTRQRECFRDNLPGTARFTKLQVKFSRSSSGGARPEIKVYFVARQCVHVFMSDFFSVFVDLSHVRQYSACVANREDDIFKPRRCLHGVIVNERDAILRLHVRGDRVHSERGAREVHGLTSIEVLHLDTHSFRLRERLLQSHQRPSVGQRLERVRRALRACRRRDEDWLKFRLVHKRRLDPALENHRVSGFDVYECGRRHRHDC